MKVPRLEPRRPCRPSCGSDTATVRAARRGEPETTPSVIACARRGTSGASDGAILCKTSTESDCSHHGHAACPKHQRFRVPDRLLPARRAQRDRHRLSVLQLGHRSCADHRGDGAPRQARRTGAESGALPAREHRRAYGRGLCAGHRPRPGRAGARRCRHRQYRDGNAQHVPQPPAGAADGRQGALHLPQRARRYARHPCALGAGAVRPGEPGAAVSEMGMDASVRRRGQGGAAARAFDHAERAARPGLSDDAAGDADAAVGARRNPPLFRRAVRRDDERRRRPETRRRARGAADRGGKSHSHHRLWRPQRARRADDRGGRGVRRHRRVRRQHLEQYRSLEPVLRRLCARQGAAGGRRRDARRCRRAVVPRRCAAERAIVLGPYRRRRAQGRLADVDLPRRLAAPGRQRPHPRTASGRASGESDAALCRRRSAAPRAPQGGARGAPCPRRRGSRRTRASPTPSIRII